MDILTTAAIVLAILAITIGILLVIHHREQVKKDRESKPPS